MKGELACCQR